MNKSTICKLFLREGLCLCDLQQGVGNLFDVLPYHQLLGTNDSKVRRTFRDKSLAAASL